jgi:hypothetical protein
MLHSVVQHSKFAIKHREQFIMNLAPDIPKSVTQEIKNILWVLTRSMSATMDQLRFRKTSPKKMSAKHALPFTEAKREAKNRNGILTKSPMAHIRGSMRGYRDRNLCANIEPSGTPTSPDIIVMTPNLYATLQT